MSRRWWFKPKITTESSPHSNLIIYILRINFCPHSVTVWVVSLQNQKSKPTNTHRSQGLMLLPRKCTSFSYLFEMHVVMVTQLLSDWSVLSALTGFWDITREESCPLSAYCSWHTSVCVSIRGSVEPGVEALLRSAGGSLLHLSISQCPHILTDRTLWLASCYSRNLQTLTYRWGCLPVPFFTCLSTYSTVCLVICRSSSDPLGQEVLWALGAGCRSITSLQVAPAHPWLVHTHTVHCDNSILKNNKPVSLFKKKKKNSCPVCCEYNLECRNKWADLSHLDTSLFLSSIFPANSQLVLVTAACRQLAVAGHTSALSVWAELAVGLRGWLLLVSEKYGYWHFCFFSYMLVQIKSVVTVKLQFILV